jgi:hypothetical protein
MFKIWRGLAGVERVVKERGGMTSAKVLQIGALLVGALGVVDASAVSGSWVHQHSVLCAVLYVLAQLLHAVLPSIFGPANPEGAQAGGGGAKLSGLVLAMLALGAMLPCAARGQTELRVVSVGPGAQPIAAPVGVTVSSDAVAMDYRGAWSAGTMIDQSFDLIDFGAKRSNRLLVAGSELLAPGPGWAAYLGKAIFVPDVSGLIAKTNVSPGSFGVSLDGAVGVGTPSNAGSSIAWYAGGGVRYQVTSGLTWQSLQAQYGGVGAERFAAISTGLSFLFGK